MCYEVIRKPLFFVFFCPPPSPLFEPGGLGQTALPLRSRPRIFLPAWTFRLGLLRAR